jgi:hypothetical protein
MSPIPRFSVLAREGPLHVLTAATDAAKSATDAAVAATNAAEAATKAANAATAAAAAVAAAADATAAAAVASGSTQSWSTKDSESRAMFLAVSLPPLACVGVSRLAVHYGR